MTLRTRSVLIISLAAAGVSVPGIAQVDHSMHGKPTGSPVLSASDAALADGLVKKIDKASKRITIAHGKLPNGMPAMTMAFSLKDAAWLDQVQTGQKIRFATDSVNSMLVVRLEVVK